MVTKQHLVETFIDDLLLPEVGPPGFQTVPTGDALQILSHLGLIQLHQVVYLLVLAFAGLHGCDVLLSLIEEKQSTREGLHHPG